jgi:hypothetical protein
VFLAGRSLGGELEERNENFDLEDALQIARAVWTEAPLTSPWKWFEYRSENCIWKSTHVRLRLTMKGGID